MPIPAVQGSRRKLQAITQSVIFGVPAVIIGCCAIYAATRFVNSFAVEDEHAGIVTAGLVSLLLCVAFVGALTAAAIALWRRAIHQHCQLIELKQERTQIKSAYQQVVENLPIGLFTFENNDFQYANWAWDEQVMRQPGQTPGKALLEALHPDDRQRVFNELRIAQEQEQPFQIQFRLLSEFEGERHISSHGVPVYSGCGDFEHLLGFHVDLSDTVRAHHQLRRTNAEIEQKNLMLRRTLAELEDNFRAMVESLVKAVEAKDPYTAGHSERVMTCALKIGQQLGLCEHDLMVLRMGSLIHDIGKIGIPDAILSKPGDYTEDEYTVIRQHSLIGHEMVKDIPLFKECAPIVLHHHERMDGAGYPAGLKGSEIPMLIRITSVADVFDAITSDRSYRRALPVHIALQELRREVMGNRLDGTVVEALDAALRQDEGIQRRAA